MVENGAGQELRVSVVLPAYNAAHQLPQALDSLLSQDEPSFEVLAVDDGSLDRTWEVLEGYAARSDRIRPLRLAHGGIVPALNAGIERARGRYIARMDADDLCRPERLRFQADHLDDHPAHGLVACRVGFGGDRARAGGYAHYVDWTNSLTAPEDIALARFQESPLAHPSVMFRKELCSLHGGYRDGDFPEDYELWLRWMDRGVAMAKLPQELVVWNDPPDRLSRTDPRYDVDRFYEVKGRYLARWLTANNPFHPEVVVIGSGRISRKRAEVLCGHGVAITAYVDIDPRKVGHVIHGRPVLHRDDMSGPDECFAVSYVGSRGAADDIAGFLAGRGFTPGRHFILAA